MAAAAGSRIGRPAHSQSAFRAFPVEDSGQLEAQSGSHCLAASDFGQLAAPAGTGRPGIAGGCFDHRAPWIIVSVRQCVSQAG